MTEENVSRRLSAILSADVKGYSQLMRKDEVGTIRNLNFCREQIGTLVGQHHGRVVDSPGDNILAEFASVVDAVQAAVAIQKELKAHNEKMPISSKMEFRIGINLGDLIVEDERIYGDGVNMAARLEAIAEPGGICISRTAYDQIEDKLPFGYEYLGEKKVKNDLKPIRAYKILFEPQNVNSKFKQWTDKHIKTIKTPTQTESEWKDDTGAVSDKKRLVTFILCLCFGYFGAHRFYAGKTKTAKLMLFTIGGLGIWYVIDIVLVIFGELLDDKNRKISRWV